MLPKAVLMFIMIGACGGCRYYQIRDAQTGKVYYTEEWVAADGYTGPLTFKDESGSKIRLKHAGVEKLSKNEYLELSEAARSAKDSTGSR